jgi:hypothetical protein
MLQLQQSWQRLQQILRLQSCQQASLRLQRAWWRPLRLLQSCASALMVLQ